MKETRRLAGRFLLLHAFGPGGATEAWLAEDSEIEEHVTLRLLAAPLADRWETLRDASRLTRRLAHPRIARVFDFQRSGDALFLSREFVAGDTEGAGLAGCPVHELLPAFASVAAALELAHAQGVVHGDLKHSKILLDTHGQVRVVDFSIASGLRAAATAAGIEMPLGATVSPQVRTGEAPVAADDIYSLGTIISGVLGAIPASKELRELVESMCEQRRDARPNDLSEIRQALMASAAPELEAPASRRATLASVPDPVASTPTKAPTRPEGTARNLHYVVALGLLGLVVLVVIFWLPRWVERAAGTEPVVEAEEVAEETPTPTEAPNASREDVEVVLAKVLSAREELAGQAVERWAPDRFNEALELEAEGDRAIVANDHDAAWTRYNEALEVLEQLKGERATVLMAALEAGRTAIGAGDSLLATEEFQLALSIDPANAQALAGIREAETLDEVLEHMSAGERLETAGDPIGAAAEYEKALALNSEWTSAREALDRVGALRDKKEFEQSLSLGLVALARGELATARTHLEQARSLEPRSPEVTDGLRQLRQAESSRTITSHRRRAEEAEQDEDWDEAASHYQAILDSQGNLAFAEEGLSRNRELSAMSERIEELLSDPRQLFRPEVLQEAQRLMSECQRYSEDKPQLAEQLRRLEITIRLASTPIPVEFRSDSETEVVIRAVGTLGNFDRREVPLKPGHYVVIGRRNGYRDVRREISVNPGSKPPVVEVWCTEEI